MGDLTNMTTVEQMRHAVAKAARHRVQADQQAIAGHKRSQNLIARDWEARAQALAQCVMAEQALPVIQEAPSGLPWGLRELEHLVELRGALGQLEGMVKVPVDTTRLRVHAMEAALTRAAKILEATEYVDDPEWVDGCVVGVVRGEP